MLEAANTGQDLYATVAARAFHTTFEDCLEHFPKDTPIVNENNSWRYATEDEIVNGSYDKLADGETDTYKDGKERRKKAKVILLGLMYGMNSKTIAEMLGCSMEEAEGIMSSVFDAFPKIKELIAERQNFARKHKYTSTIWGRKRRLPDIALPLYEFDFSGCPDAIKNDIEWQEENKRKWTQLLQSLKYRDRIRKKEELEKKFGLKIYFNQEKISRAERQVLNSIIQGSAADMSKKAIVAIHQNQELKDLGLRMLVPIHDEILVQCPLANAKRCKELFTYEMENCAKDKISLDIKVDPACSFAWYGDEISVK